MDDQEGEYDERHSVGRLRCGQSALLDFWDEETHANLVTSIVVLSDTRAENQSGDANIDDNEEAEHVGEVTDSVSSFDAISVMWKLKLSLGPNTVVLEDEPLLAGGDQPVIAGCIGRCDNTTRHQHPKPHQPDEHAVAKLLHQPTSSSFVWVCHHQRVCTVLQEKEDGQKDKDVRPTCPKTRDIDRQDPGDRPHVVREGQEVVGHQQQPVEDVADRSDSESDVRRAVPTGTCESGDDTWQQHQPND